MLITIDTSKALTDSELEIIYKLLPKDDSHEAPAPAAKPARAKKPKESAPAAAPEPETVDQLEDAIALATRLVSDGQREKVKEALHSAGVARVTELEPSAVSAFMEALRA